MNDIELYATDCCQKNKMAPTNKSPFDECKNSDNYKSSRTASKVYKLLGDKLPILQWLPKYDRFTFVSDLIAGITLGLTLVPQSIAYASLAGLKVHYGLYSAFIGTILYVFFGTIKEVSIGPTSLMALLVLQICKDLPIEYVILLTFLSGCVVMVMGLLRLGFLVDLISAPVTSGFTSATSIIIAVSQLKGILGLKFDAESLIENFQLMRENIGATNMGDVILGINCIMVLLLLRKLKDVPAKNIVMKKTLWMISISRNAIVVLSTSLVAAYFSWKDPLHLPITLSGKVDPGLPPFSLPAFSVTVNNRTVGFTEMCADLGSGIVVTPIVMVLANIAIAKAFASGVRVNATQEMFTLGLCNIVGSFFHAMPTTGAFTRSAVSNASGIKTPMAGVYSGAMTLLALVFMTKYFYFIPRATLSAVLICAVIFMVDFKIMWTLWKSNKCDFCMLMVTFVIGLLKNVEIALFVGMLVNISLLIYSWTRPNISTMRLKASTGGEYVKVMPGVGLFYLNIDYFSARVADAAAEQGEGALPVVIDCSRLQAIDYSACQGLEQLNNKFRATTQKLIFYNASADVVQKLESIQSIDSRHLHSRTEGDLLDALFCAREDAGRMECTPLLAEAFRKKDSVCEPGVKYEMRDLKLSKVTTVTLDDEKVNIVPDQ